MNLCCFQIHDWESSTFPKSEVLPVYLALFNSMCSHDVLCCSLEVIEFDVELMILYFFENIHLLLILKCILHYLGLSLTDILTCAVLCVA